MFSIHIPCTGNISGVATFSIGLAIHSKKGKPLNNTPFRLKLRKECYPRGWLRVHFTFLSCLDLRSLEVLYSYKLYEGVRLFIICKYEQVKIQHVMKCVKTVEFVT